MPNFAEIWKNQKNQEKIEIGFAPHIFIEEIICSSARDTGVKISSMIL